MGRHKTTGDIDFTAEATEAVDMAIDLATQEIGNQLTPSADAVKAAAANLTLYADSLIAQAQANETMLAGLNTENSTQVISFSKRLVDTREKFIHLMDLVFKFQNISNEYLGQRVQMTFVSISKSGQVELYAVDNDIEHLKIDRASSKRGGAFSGRYNYSKRDLEQTKRIINSKYNKSSLDSTFSEVYRRYNISKTRLKMGGAAYILWKENGWDGAWISGAGPLGEGYLNFFVNEYLFSGMVESDIRDFMLNSKYGAVNADNASGLLQGDITKDGIEYGVKMKGASAFSYMEVIEYARQIQDAADVGAFLRDLKQTLQNKAASNLVKPLNGMLNDELNSLLEPLENAIKS